MQAGKSAAIPRGLRRWRCITNSPRTGRSSGLCRSPSARAGAGFSYGGRDLFANGDSLDFKLTVFNTRIKDKIERPGNAVPGPTYANIARARIRGVELEGGYDAETIFGKFAYSRILGTDQTTGARLNSTPADELVLELGARAFDQTLEYGWRGTFLRKASRADGEAFPGYGVNDLASNEARRGRYIRLLIGRQFSW
ncbi:TonB-dependent receptor domain-containing protein [Natronohydrobacter thiooxidans]|uniref:TonB-dependent receptor domain-containing protein n=1 Tax=Natronohydrobacter thiooxidans TaxID=87172 RepID=UPI0008FF5707|nr:TonB-dependent receptor [Natronohydrobacter thiooxidans]